SREGRKLSRSGRWRYPVRNRRKRLFRVARVFQRFVIASELVVALGIQIIARRARTIEGRFLCVIEPYPQVRQFGLNLCLGRNVLRVDRLNLVALRLKSSGRERRSSC